jgi:hypothetical protein
MQRSLVKKSRAFTFTTFAARLSVWYRTNEHFDTHLFVFRKRVE